MKIKVEGVEYDFPAIDSITLDESIVLERYSGVGIEELIPGEKMPMGAIKAFVVIAVMRARPDSTEREIASVIGKIKLGELDTLVEEEDASPPAEAPTESGESTTTSGDDGSTASVPSPEPPIRLATGNQGSATGSTSGQETLAG